MSNIDTTQIKCKYKNLISLTQHMLKHRFENTKGKRKTLKSINKLTSIPTPTTFEEHNELIDLIVLSVKQMVCMPDYFYFKSRFEDSSIEVLRASLHREYDNEHLKNNGYVCQPRLLRHNENINPELDFHSAYLELLEINELILNEYIEYFHIELLNSQTIFKKRNIV